ncbi:hypothetical protein HNY73_006530 [Argiope bruennichi]|uniref:Uncharacterized protein n=1 Tax=Argiope bruennichi TaxID=94029 RepID=A0A8T0FB68_ARGBR|nr:hypothetical protein HNY73_006530 [Argiope bruennichi]
MTFAEPGHPSRQVAGEPRLLQRAVGAGGAAATDEAAAEDGERAQSEKHMSTWDSFWGRPGHGAPIKSENHKKENLINLLQSEAAQPYVKHYVTEIVPSKHKNRYEFPTKDVMAIKKDYEFRTPFPATEA